MVCVARDSLRSDVRRLNRNATVIERNTVEDRRRRLEGRIKTFHNKADTLMLEVDLDDVGPLVEKKKERLPDWDDGKDSDRVGIREDEEDPQGVEEDEAIGGLSGSEDAAENEVTTADRPDKDDEEDDTEHAEWLSLFMPSSLGKKTIDKARLGTLAVQEIELRVGQANDALGDLRVELGHKALLFRTKIRHTKNTKGKTRAWKEVNHSTLEVMRHVRRYERARRALVRLEADDGILENYQDIKREDLTMSGDILEENRVGQKNTTMAWFWRLGPQGTGGNDWMEECECSLRCD